MHTVDIYNEETSKSKLSTQEFTKAVISRLGEKPSHFKVADYAQSKILENKHVYEINTREVKTLVGVDVVVNWNKESPVMLAEEIMWRVNILLVHQYSIMILMAL